MTHTATYPEKALVWTDVETTGTVAHRGHLLQIAILVTDLDLNVLEETGYEATVGYTAEQSAAMRDAADPIVRDMHDTNGLWNAITDPTTTKSTTTIAAEALAYVQQLVPERRTARMAGNSLRLDLNFVEEHLPPLYEHLHYRMLDVSSWTGPAQWWAGIEPMPKARNHTAMADIRESIEEMRFVRRALGLEPHGGMLTLREAASALGVSRSTADRMVEAGTLPIAVRTLGGHRRFDPETVRELLSARAGAAV
ncbi:oligoribonuclease [Cellulomonas hominis]|nr:oligoribonuclease [Cellulomonas hominis]MBB5474844.1 oligoribonuclease [Cellulomonas hominis]NKY05631.1 oligoribonuclease [Cellulomonas hominis]